jgi:hypothetical protein
VREIASCQWGSLRAHRCVHTEIAFVLSFWSVTGPDKSGKRVIITWMSLRYSTAKMTRSDKRCDKWRPVYVMIIKRNLSMTTVAFNPKNWHNKTYLVACPRFSRHVTSFHEQPYVDVCTF